MSDPAALAADVTRRSASNLWFVGRALTAPKRRLFQAAYATMRVIDDLVDDGFLALSAGARAVERPAALEHVAAWIRAADAAVLRGEVAVEGLTDADARSLIRALADAAGPSDLPPDPWHRLGEAMAFDIREEPLAVWDDFLSYCEGATVAPASIFLYVLQARPDRDGALKAGIPAERLADQARDMAIFCYLVHILRDFRRDAARGGQLVTVPESCFEDHGLTRAAAASAPDQAVPVLADLARRADGHRRAARDMAQSLKPAMTGRDWAILDALLSIYEGLHDSLLVDPDPTAERAGLTARLRETLAARLGLAGADG
jgi:phytoene synthase